MSKIKSKQWSGQPAKYAHLKMDGHFTRIVTDLSGGVRVYTSHPHDITAQCVGGEWGWLRPFYTRIPFGTTILGELYVPGHNASDVKTALIERWDKLVFSAFAVETMPEACPLEDVSSFCQKFGLDFLMWRRIIEGDTVEGLMERLPRGAEGYVLKDGNLLNWYKLKPVRTIDLIVDGFIAGNGKYDGCVGSLICRTIEGYYVASAGGMDDDMRWEITANQSKYIGRVAEIKYQLVGNGGKLRHPRFCRWRDDKLPEECGVDQDPDLEEFWDGKGHL